MEPIQFDEANSTLLGGPPEKYGVEVMDLPTFKDGEQIVSAWKPTLRERLSVLFHGKVWFRIRTPDTHAPISIEGAKTIFTPTASTEDKE